MLTTLCRRLKHARHNLIAHPIAGLLWLFGFEMAGDWIHDHL